MNIKEYSLHNLKLLRSLVSPEFDEKAVLNTIQIHQTQNFDKDDPNKDSIILRNIQDMVSGYMLRHKNEELFYMYDFLDKLIKEIEKTYQ